MKGQNPVTPIKESNKQTNNDSTSQQYLLELVKRTIFTLSHEQSKMTYFNDQTYFTLTSQNLLLGLDQRSH